MENGDRAVVALPDGRSVSYVTEEGYDQTMTEEVEPELAKRRKIQAVPVRGGTLHGESYVQRGAKKAIVMVHGYTESAEKLREMAWYFLQAGFSVFSYDGRGHGRSLRHVEDLSVTHVNRFQDYVDDLDDFIRLAVKPEMGGAPLYLYAHSMGGAVGANYLLQHPDAFRRAVLSSPMIAPSTAPIPWGLARVLAECMCLAGQGKRRAFVGKPYDPERETFEAGFSTSPARFEYYTRKRRNTPCLQNCAPTYGWVRESMAQTKALLHSPAAGQVQTEVLLFQAGQETIVRQHEQNRFIARLPHGELVRAEGARHEIYNSADDVMKPYVEKVLTFLAEAENKGDSI